MYRSAESRDRRVLVVDDEPTMRELLTRRLAIAGCDALEAKDGYQARVRIPELRDGSRRPGCGELGRPAPARADRARLSCSSSAVEVSYCFSRAGTVASISAHGGRLPAHNDAQGSHVERAHAR